MTSTQPLWHRLMAGERTAPVVLENDQTLYRAAFNQQVYQLAGALQQAGVGPGDRVALAFGNQSAFLVSFLAVWQLGAVVVPINLQWPEADIGYVLHHAGVKLVMAAQPIADKYAGSCPLPLWGSNGQNGTWEQALQNASPVTTLTPRADTDLAVLMYTSGTTGKPKGVMLSEKNLATNLNGVGEVFSFGEQDMVLLALPLFHAFGLILTLYCVTVSAPLLMVARWTPNALAQALMQQPVTVLPLVPTLFSLLVQGLKGQQPDRLKYCISGGATLPAKLLAQVEAALGCPVLEGYGLTETSPVVAVNRPSDGSTPGAVGQIFPGVQVALLDEQDRWLPLQPGQDSAVGEICVKGDSVMLGYYQQPEATAQVMTADGWFKTGDLGHLDAQGKLYISGGRKKDLIIKAGENISPVRIEAVLYQHPAVAEACVYAVPDDRVGEEIMAAVVLKPGHEQADLKKHCLADLPACMVPKVITVLPELPKNAVGKVVRHDVATLCQAQPSAARV
jgi:long-chain acyl-CoA synthetase